MVAQLRHFPKSSLIGVASFISRIQAKVIWSLVQFGESPYPLWFEPSCGVLRPCWGSAYTPYIFDADAMGLSRTPASTCSSLWIAPLGFFRVDTSSITRLWFSFMCCAVKPPALAGGYKALLFYRWDERQEYGAILRWIVFLLDHDCQSFFCNLFARRSSGVPKRL